MLNITTLTPERIRRLSSEGLWIVVGQAAAVVGALVGVRLLTELLDPATYGELALGMTAAALVNQVLLGPLGNGATRFYAPAAEQGQLAGYLAGVRRLLGWAGVAVGVMLAAGVVLLFAAGRKELVGMTVAAFAFALVSGCAGIVSGVQNAARQRTVVAVHQGLEPWVRFLTAAGLLMALHAASDVALWGYAAASALVLASQLRFFRRSIAAAGPRQAGDSWQDQIWRYSWPFGTWGIFTWLQLASDRWALEHFSTTQEVGLYVVLYQLGYYPISMATGMAVQFLAPILFKRAGDAKDQQRNESVDRLTWRLGALALVLTCIASLVTLAFHRQIFSVFVSRDYASVSVLLPLVILSGGIFAAGQTIALHLMSLMRTQAMVSAKIVTALLGAVLNFAGAYAYGTAGVVVAGLLFSISYLVWMGILSRRTQQE